jgi:amino acid permease
MLLLSAAKTGVYSYGKLFTYSSNSRFAGPFLDIVIVLFGQGVVIAYFVFLGDFVPAVTGGGLLSNRTTCILLFGLTALPLAIPSKLSALQYITPISTLSLILTAAIVVFRIPSMRDITEPEIDYARFTLGLFKSFSIIISSFICHTNVVSVAGELVDPCKRRSTKIALRAAAVQVVLYLIISVSGYLTFGRSVAQNFITNYSIHDPLIKMCRIMLSITIFFGIPMNTNPTAKALVNLLSSSDQGSKDGLDSPLLSPTLKDTPRGLEDLHRGLRIGIGVMVISIGAIVSLFIPGIADVVSILGGSFGTLIMLVFPALIYKSIFKLNRTECVLINLLFVSAGVCLLSVGLIVIDWI